MKKVKYVFGLLSLLFLSDCTVIEEPQTVYYREPPSYRYETARTYTWGHHYRHYHSTPAYPREEVRSNYHAHPSQEMQSTYHAHPSEMNRPQASIEHQTQPFRQGLEGSRMHGHG